MKESIIQKKVAKLIQRELGDMFRMGTKYAPQGAMVTVSVVRIAPDFTLAKVYISAFPDHHLEPLVERYNEIDWEIRMKLGERIRNKIRRIPELNFYADTSFQEADRINKLMDEIEVKPEDENKLDPAEYGEELDV